MLCGVSLPAGLTHNKQKIQLLQSWVPIMAKGKTSLQLIYLLNTDEVLEAITDSHQPAVINTVGCICQNYLLFVDLTNIKILGMPKTPGEC